VVYLEFLEILSGKPLQQAQQMV